MPSLVYGKLIYKEIIANGNSWETRSCSLSGPRVIELTLQFLMREGKPILRLSEKGEGRKKNEKKRRNSRPI